MKSFNRFYMIFSVLFVGLESFNAGIASTKHYWSDFVFDLLIAVFWGGAIFIINELTVKSEVARKTADELEKTAERGAQEAERVINEMLQRFEVPAHVHAITKPKKDGGK